MSLDPIFLRKNKQQGVSRQSGMLNFTCDSINYGQDKLRQISKPLMKKLIKNSQEQRQLPQDKLFQRAHVKNFLVTNS